MQACGCQNAGRFWRALWLGLAFGLASGWLSGWFGLPSGWLSGWFGLASGWLSGWFGLALAGFLAGLVWLLAAFWLLDLASGWLSGFLALCRTRSFPGRTSARSIWETPSKERERGLPTEMDHGRAAFALSLWKSTSARHDGNLRLGFALNCFLGAKPDGEAPEKQRHQDNHA